MYNNLRVADWSLLNLSKSSKEHANRYAFFYSTLSSSDAECVIRLKYLFLQGIFISGSADQSHAVGGNGNLPILVYNLDIKYFKIVLLQIR